MPHRSPRNRTRHVVTLTLLLILIAGPAIAPGPGLTTGQATVTDAGLSADGANITRLYTVDTTAGYRLYFGNLTDAPYLTSTAADAISTPDTLQVDGRAKLSHTNSSVCLGNGASTYDACIFRSTANEVQASDDLAVTDDLRVGDVATISGDLVVAGTLTVGDAKIWARRVTIAAGTTVSLDGDTSAHSLAGFLVVSRDDGITATLCTIMLRGQTAPVEMDDPSSICGVTDGVASVNVFYTSPYTRVKNGGGSPIDVVLMFEGYHEA